MGCYIVTTTRDEVSYSWPVLAPPYLRITEGINVAQSYITLSPKVSISAPTAETSSAAALPEGGAVDDVIGNRADWPVPAAGDWVLKEKSKPKSKKSNSSNKS